ncbi:hypothetical protein TL16_g02175 [Triparma laevis f. inornata]|uniref:Uncharacterized protein n=2 Tax=Triparma laevis TaxID=1534972 RepID=A0A9W7FEL2_9STRA|nr:hypothetical protein TL16_g02175 [Triparma laevis f. inornata]GMI10706.1 hypothetical protein TrLO_g9019 [Triparma laevis f. longispina]
MPKAHKKTPEPIATPPPTPTLLTTLSSSNKQTLITALSHLTTLYPKGNVGPTLQSVETIRKILTLSRHGDKVVEKLALQCLIAFFLNSQPDMSSLASLASLDFTQVLKGNNPAMRLDLYNTLLTLDVVRPEVNTVCSMNEDEAFKVLRTITEWELNESEKSAITAKCSNSDSIEALGALNNLGVDVREKIRAFSLPELGNVEHLLKLTQERRQEIMDELAEKDVLKKQKEKDETSREIAKRQKELKAGLGKVERGENEKAPPSHRDAKTELAGEISTWLTSATVLCSWLEVVNDVVGGGGSEGGMSDEAPRDEWAPGGVVDKAWGAFCKAAEGGKLVEGNKTNGKMWGGCEEIGSRVFVVLSSSLENGGGAKAAAEEIWNGIFSVEEKGVAKWRDFSGWEGVAMRLARNNNFGLAEKVDGGLVEVLGNKCKHPDVVGLLSCVAQLGGEERVKSVTAKVLQIYEGAEDCIIKAECLDLFLDVFANNESVRGVFVGEKVAERVEAVGWVWNGRDEEERGVVSEVKENWRNFGDYVRGGWN